MKSKVSRAVLRCARGLALVLAATLLPCAPASAEPLIPSLMVPDWWRNKYQDLYIGFWGPCGHLGLENDCIESIEVAPEGNAFQSVDWKSNPDWTPTDTRVWWRDDRAMGLAGSVSPGDWHLPSALAINGSTAVRADIQAGDWSFGFRLEAMGGELPEGWLFRVTVKSRSIQKYMSPYLTGNSKDSTFLILDPQRFQFSARSSAAPYPGDTVNCTALFAGNQERAERTKTSLRIAWGMDQDGHPYKPGSVTLATNGWYCFGGVEFDAKTREIVAKIGTAHYDETGKIVDGWLEVNINGDLALRWWGIDPATAVNYAKVLLTYADGTTKSATLTVKYDKADNLILLRAYGFSYSTPVVRISMAKPAAKTITCVQGKKVVKVKSTKCPTGFRKR